MVNVYMDPGVRRPEPVGLGRGVGRGVIERKPEPPTATVLLIYCKVKFVVQFTPTLKFSNNL